MRTKEQHEQAQCNAVLACELVKTVIMDSQRAYALDYRSVYQRVHNLLGIAVDLSYRFVPPRDGDPTNVASLSKFDLILAPSLPLRCVNLEHDACRNDFNAAIDCAVDTLSNAETLSALDSVVRIKGMEQNEPVRLKSLGEVHTTFYGDGFKNPKKF